MSYHTTTFRLLNSEPMTSVEMQATVQETERQLGISLPPSVREWYLCGDAMRILAEHSNQDPPIALREFAVFEWQSRHLLPIRHENQGVCTWAIALDGSEDPPVLVDVDSGGKEWQPQAPSFSAYVYSCVWDYRQVFGRPALIQAQNVALSRVALDGLRAAFSEELQTQGWPGDAQYRFTNGRAAILIWSAGRQADWFIASSDAATLEGALLAIWHLDSLGKSLYGCSEMGKAVLQKIRDKA